MALDFTESDAILAHLDGLIGAIADPFIRSRYTGFVAVCAITAIEVNIRRHVLDFCMSKHKVFGTFTESMFAKTNARVKVRQLRDEFLVKFGKRYDSRFAKRIELAERDSLSRRTGSLQSSYANLVQWRHDFVHDGVLPAYATYEEARAAYDHAKVVVQCFADSLVR